MGKGKKFKANHCGDDHSVTQSISSDKLDSDANKDIDGDVKKSIVSDSSSDDDSIELDSSSEAGENLEDRSEELPSIQNDFHLDADLISEEPLHLLMPKLMRLNSKDLISLQDKNLLVKKGRFSASENSILSRNWKRYLEDYHIPNPKLLLGHFQYGRHNESATNLKKYYQNFAKKTKLWLRLAKDLPDRTIYQIYCRARVVLSGLKSAKDFRKKDRERILDLYLKHGDQYSSFCEYYGYCPKSAREVVRNSIKANGEQLNQGEWKHKEIMKLKKIVTKLIKELGLKSYDRIPWSLVAKKLKRSDVMCRQKFFSKSILKMMSTQNSDWNDSLDIAKFIALLKYLNYSDQYMIDWDFIKEKFSS